MSGWTAAGAGPGIAGVAEQVKDMAQARRIITQQSTELAAARALLREVVETADMFKRGMENLGAVTGPNEQIERIRSYLDACDTMGSGNG